MGQHLLRALDDCEARIVALVRAPEEPAWNSFCTRHPEVATKIDVRCLDLLDGDAVMDALKGIEVAFHLAGRGGAAGGYRDYADANITATCNLLAAAERQRLARLVHVSTAAVYGPAGRTPVDENHPTSGWTIYAASKIGAESLVRAYAARGGSTVVLRPSNIYGPDQTADTVVTSILRQISAGDVIALRTLTPIRDFIFVADVVGALLAAAARTDIPSGAAFNISSGIGHSIQNLAETAVRAVRGERLFSDVTIKSDVDRNVSPLDCLICSNAAAKDALGWVPAVALREGLAATYYASKTGETSR